MKTDIADRDTETLLHLPTLVAEVEAKGSTIGAYREAFAPVSYTHLTLPTKA